ncbi:MAG: ribosome silencing factor [Lentisphaeria bacterium]|jgi:ribosome-associated protein|nr:ribosome silencing factor [Lentisphaeria bacterium]
MDNYLVNVDSEALAKHCVAICEERKAENVVLFDVRETSVLADYYLLCTANSMPHIRAISDHLKIEVQGEFDLVPRAREGDAASEWVIMDYGVVIVHILEGDRRRFYNVEELWNPERVIYRSAPQDAAASQPIREF